MQDLECYIHLPDPLLATVARRVAREGGRQTLTPREASAFVVANPSKLSQHMQWQACLRGLPCLAPDLACHITFRRATSTKRSIWVSDAFQQQRPTLATLVLRAIQEPSSLWRQISHQQFQTLKLTGLQKIALVSSGERKAPGSELFYVCVESTMCVEATPDQPNVFDAADFQVFLWSVAGQALGEMPAV